MTTLARSGERVEVERPIKVERVTGVVAPKRFLFQAVFSFLSLLVHSPPRLVQYAVKPDCVHMQVKKIEM